MEPFVLSAFFPCLNLRVILAQFEVNPCDGANLGLVAFSLLYRHFGSSRVSKLRIDDLSFSTPKMALCRPRKTLHVSKRKWPIKTSLQKKGKAH